MDFLRPDAMPIHPEQALFLLICDFKLEAVGGEPHPKPSILWFRLRCQYDVELGRPFWLPALDLGLLPSRSTESDLQDIRETIKAKIEQGHEVREDRREGSTDDLAAVAAEVRSQVRFRVASPHVRLHRFRVKLLAT